MEVPDHLLTTIVCAQCNCYLSSEPVMVSTDGRNLCSRCSHQFTTARNYAYESLAKLMVFPCQNRANGCQKQIVWNRAAKHEIYCEFNNGHHSNSPAEMHELCSVCQVNISYSPNYQCAKGHLICPKCTNTASPRCLLCKSKIDTEMKYLCKFWKSGCKIKDNTDVIKRHEIDCDMRGFSCPFIVNDCNWIGSVYSMSHHLKSNHYEHIVDIPEVKRTFRMKDDNWVMQIYGEEIFSCHVWLGESDVEWLAKYIGPQKRASMYSCELKIFNNSKTATQVFSNKCTGWNTISLDKSIKIPYTQLTKFMTNNHMDYIFQILKKNHYF